MLNHAESYGGDAGPSSDDQRDDWQSTSLAHSTGLSVRQGTQAILFITRR
jgi:hypothetical protein